MMKQRLSEKGWIDPILILFFLGMMSFPGTVSGGEIHREGWPVPGLKGLVPYSVTVKTVDGVEKIVEKFDMPDGGHVARISGNGRVFAYAVDSDHEPPIDYFLLDPDGNGIFTQKFEAEESYSIPDWVSN